MKNIISKILLLIVLLFANTGFAQDVRMEGNSKTYLETMDSLLTNIDKQKITTGILYNRVMSFTELPLQTDDGERRVYDAGYFIQSWSELNRASYQPTFMTIEELKTLNNLTSSRDSLAVNIGIINTKINYIDYGSTANPSIIIENGYFKTTTALDPFTETQVTIIAPLKSTVYAKIVKFKLLPELILQLSGKRIKNIEADFATGVQYNMVQNFVTNNAFMEVTYETSGSKTLLFHLTYDDDSTETLTATINVNIPLTAMGVPPDCLAQNFVGNEGIDATTSSNMAFQGYNETVPSKGKIEYRTYYNKVTNSCGNPLKIVKPIIILDGYDPGDKRKIYDGSANYNFEDKSLFELMEYDDDNNSSTIPVNLVEKLRSAPYGFDVTLVNFPNGADYIERNAMALVALISRERAKLIANSSTEQISIIGPSMGGLVSRYALAYMEKNNIPHNTKLWVSFDSPHLGANIPMSAQDCIYFFGYDGAQDDAKTQFNENFRSPAGRQMLIEQLDNKHEAAPYPSILWNSNVPSGRNNQSPFRQQFQNSLISNGVAGSDGYPQNLRKIALINGSTNGTKVFNEKQKYLELAGFIKIKWGQIFGTSFITRIKGISFENRYMARFDDWSQTFKGYVIVQSEFASYGKTLTRRNINPRGSMDNVPGGLFPIGKVLQESFDKGLDDMPIINERQWRVNLKNSAFIPSVSALAFKNPNFNWSNSLNRNLVCDPNNKEIYFDSYFAPKENEEHVLVTAESANWLLKELEGIPQAPSFPFNNNVLSGPTIFCSSANFSFADVCKIPSSVTWTTSTSLQTVSSSGYNLNVNATEDGKGFIKATFQNGESIKREVWVGKPRIYHDQGFFDANLGNPESLVLCQSFGYNENNKKTIFANGFTPDSQWEIVKLSGVFVEWQRNGNIINFSAYQVGNFSFKVRVSNICGWSDWVTYNMKVVNCPNGNLNQVQSTTNENIYKIYPNPAQNIVNISLKNINNQPDSQAVISGELFDMNGVSKAIVQINNNQASFSVAGLPLGVYVLNIFINGQVEGHQIAVE